VRPLRRIARREVYDPRVPTFDIVSELDFQEVRNAVDQANREATTRFDFKNTDSNIEVNEKELVLTSSTEDRLRALYQVLEEKLVRREVSLKALDPQKIEEAAKGTARQHVTLKAGISQDVGKSINRLVKDLGLKGVSSSLQGDQVRVSGKKRDDLQEVIAACKQADLGVPLQFVNFRD
jgi:cyclic-di-GMP-binding protein